MSALGSSQESLGSEVIYEQPLSEKIRTLLRLEFLFRQVEEGLSEQNRWHHRQVIIHWLGILEIFSRGDLKKELINELERQVKGLNLLKGRTGVDQGLLSETLEEAEALLGSLYDFDTRALKVLRENEFLYSLKQRSSIPGGTCDFDIPAYHHWLENPDQERHEDLTHWWSTIDSFRYSIRFIVELLRSSSVLEERLADNGFYQQTLEATAGYQLLRVALPRSLKCYTEISAGRHRVTIRFLTLPDINHRSLQYPDNVKFKLACCLL